MNHIKRLIFLITMLVSASSFAFTECTKTPSKVWLDINGDAVWICFAEPGCIKTGESYPNMDSRKLNAFYSMALTAVATGKQMRIRYPENGFDCATPTARGDFAGVWLL